jgi:hypothetical protein
MISKIFCSEYSTSNLCISQYKASVIRSLSSMLPLEPESDSLLHEVTLLLFARREELGSSVTLGAQDLAPQFAGAQSLIFRGLTFSEGGQL